MNGTYINGTYINRCLIKINHGMLRSEREVYKVLNRLYYENLDRNICSRLRKIEGLEAGLYVG